eukprot:TRINITY_DN40730_c0_g1_i1.p1 TRINITY_DN40730_c0_g1~~TRINITY_DN40730_c0_g1_i1.p1  ORF type:complete len:403 (+),score=31.80 TRINITY_DN40730_c0_g1_i1:323-1531(+)
MKILICDDYSANRDGWIKAIASVLPPGSTPPVPLEQPKAEFRELLARQKAKREKIDRPDTPCAFDDQDVLVIDYDLVEVDAEFARHTGEELARLCRMFARVGYVIILNQYNRAVDFDFDLTMQRHPNSYGDLNISANTVGQQGLWQSFPENEFRPWHWDDIASVVKTRRTLADGLAEAGLNVSIADTIGIPNAAIDVMPDKTFEFLDRTRSTTAEFRQVTFHDFLKHEVEGKEVPGLEAWNKERAATWAVSRAAKWLSRMLLDPQEILVDVPHLIDRLPFLLDPEFGAAEDPATWANLPQAGPEAIVEPVRSAALFGQSHQWLGKATFWWPIVEQHEYVREQRPIADLSKLPYLVFAEDRSKFVEAKEATAFRSDDNGRYQQRWVSPVDGLRYEPRRRLLEY